MKKNIRKISKELLVFFISLFILANNVDAQVNLYDFQSSSGTYTEITGGNIVATASGNSGAASLDDANYTLATGTIPFGFLFDGVSYTSCTISSNGYITFGSTLPIITSYSPLSAAIAYSGAISAMGANLNAYYFAGIPAQTGQIRYQTLGLAPNRVFVIQFKNFKTIGTSGATYGPVLNFQIRLNESTNAIDIVYNLAGSFPLSSFQVGLRGPNNSYPANVKNRAIAVNANTWSTSVEGVANNSICQLSGSIMPAIGQTYHWNTTTCPSPQFLNVSNISTTSAVLGWTNPVAGGSFNVEFGPAGFVPGTGTSILTSNNSYSLSGLNVATNYSFYVMKSCGGGNNSLKIGPFNFSTGELGEDCSTAPTITVASSQSNCSSILVNTGFSINGPNSICSDVSGNLIGNDRWYKFIAPANGKKIVITTTSGNVNDWVMELWSSCPGGAGSVLKCGDDQNGFMPEIQLCQNEYIAGQTYYVRVWTYNSTLIGNMSMCIYETTACPLPPSNDEYSSAIILPINPPQTCPANSAVFTNLNSTVTISTTQSCDAVPSGYKDVWFKFNTGNFGDLSLTITPITAIGLKAALVFDYGGFEITCFPSANGTFNISGLNPVADYVLRVWTPATGGTPGTFSICLSDMCDSPSATISGSAVMCVGGTVQAKVDLTGYSPWTFVYTNGTTNAQVTTSTTPYYINLSPTVSEMYSLLSVNGPYCSGTVSGSAVVNIIQPSTVTLPNLGTVCTNKNLQLLGGLPAGGTYSGSYVQAGYFYANQSGPGVFNITYTYSQGSGCSRSATNTITALSAPSITSFAPTTGPVGTEVSISGLNFDGANSVMFNNTTATQVNYINSNAIHAFVPQGASNGSIKITKDNGCSNTTLDPYAVGTPSPACYLTLRVFIQGFYSSGQTMVSVTDPVNAPITTDTITVSLHSVQSPYGLVASRSGVLKSDGTCTVVFPSVYSSNYYYAAVKHRNSIETWSKIPIFLPIGGSLYNFTIPGAVQKVRNGQVEIEK